MSEQTVERDYAALGAKVETLPPPEQFRRLHESHNLDIGGGGRMEGASLAVRFSCPFDILEQGGAFDRDHRAAITRFRAAHLSFSAAMGSHYGKLNDTSRDEPTDLPLDKLYTMLLRQLSRARFKMLLMLIAPLPDDADKDLIEHYRNHLFPQKHYAEDAISALEVALEAISREEKRKVELSRAVETEDRPLRG